MSGTTLHVLYSFYIFFMRLWSHYYYPYLTNVKISVPQVLNCLIFFWMDKDSEAVSDSIKNPLNKHNLLSLNLFKLWLLSGIINMCIWKVMTTGWNSMSLMLCRRLLLWEERIVTRNDFFLKSLKKDHFINQYNII